MNVDIPAGGGGGGVERRGHLIIQFVIYIILPCNPFQKMLWSDLSFNNDSHNTTRTFQPQWQRIFGRSTLHSASLRACRVSRWWSDTSTLSLEYLHELDSILIWNCSIEKDYVWDRFSRWWAMMLPWRLILCQFHNSDYYTIYLWIDMDER